MICSYFDILAFRLTAVASFTKIIHKWCYTLNESLTCLVKFDAK